MIGIIEQGKRPHAPVLQVDRTSAPQRVGIVPQVVSECTLERQHIVIVVYFKTVPAQLVAFPVELAPYTPAETLRETVHRCFHHAAHEIVPSLQNAEIARQENEFGTPFRTHIVTGVGHFESDVGQTLMHLIAGGAFVAKLRLAQLAPEQGYDVHEPLHSLDLRVAVKTKPQVNDLP